MTTHNTAGELWNLVGQIAQSTQYQRAKAATQQPHPSPDMLYAYALDELDIEEARSIRTHLAYCSDCTDDMIAIMRIEDDEEHEEEDHAQPVKLGGEYHHALLENVADKYWEPRYAGQLATSADIPPQDHAFVLQDGQIDVFCSWEGATQDAPALIRLSWIAHLAAPGEILVRFVEPETNRIRHEDSLGSNLDGERSFTQAQIGFDPAQERWALALVVREEERR